MKEFFNEWIKEGRVRTRARGAARAGVVADGAGRIPRSSSSPSTDSTPRPLATRSPLRYAALSAGRRRCRRLAIYDRQRAQQLWKWLSANYPHFLGPENPNNALIEQIFGAQGGYY
jgi:hypothetical protein